MECGKRFNSYNNYHSHLKAKHSTSAIKTAETIDIKEPADKATKPKVLLGFIMQQPNKLVGKNKGFEQYQQDLEDKIYAFLGELGEKHVDGPR